MTGQSSRFPEPKPASAVLLTAGDPDSIFVTHNNRKDAMTGDKPKRKRGRPLKGDAPMSPAERQRRRRLRLIEAARLGTLVHIYADRMAYRLDMAEEQIQELRSALREKDRPACPGLVLKIDFSIKFLRNNLTLLQQTLPPRRHS